MISVHPDAAAAAAAANGDAQSGPARSDDHVKNGSETDVDCGGLGAPKCAEGKSCATDSDCTAACSYAKKCIAEPSCKPHLGGDTCGTGEVGDPGAKHESCCRSLKVPGYTDAAHPGKTVYVDKYEITAGRVRAWMDQLASESGRSANVKAWIAKHRPQLWDSAWDAFLPTGVEGGTMTINRRLLGDPRPEDSGSTDPPGPGVILPPGLSRVVRLPDVLLPGRHPVQRWS